MTGTIKTLISDRGFGFIQSGAQEYFFHRSAVARGVVFELLREGQSVTFEPRTAASDRGPRAESVELA